MLNILVLHQHWLRAFYPKYFTGSYLHKISFFCASITSQKLMVHLISDLVRSFLNPLTLSQLLRFLQRVWGTLMMEVNWRVLTVACSSVICYFVRVWYRAGWVTTVCDVVTLRCLYVYSKLWHDAWCVWTSWKHVQAFTLWSNEKHGTMNALSPNILEGFIFRGKNVNHTGFVRFAHSLHQWGMKNACELQLSKVKPYYHKWEA